MIEVLLFKFLKFATVGTIGMGVDFGITYFYKEKLKIQKYISNSVGFSFAVLSNYLLNRVWTFAGSSNPILSELSIFIAVSLIGLFINSSALWTLNDRLKINFYFSKLLAIGVTVFWNFFINYYFTFSNQMG